MGMPSRKCDITEGYTTPYGTGERMLIGTIFHGSKFFLTFAGTANSKDHEESVDGQDDTMHECWGSETFEYDFKRL